MFGRVMNQAQSCADGLIAERRYPSWRRGCLLLNPDPDHVNEEQFGSSPEHHLRAQPRRGRFTCDQMHNLGEALHRAALFRGNMNNFWQAVEQGKSSGMLHMERATEDNHL